MRRLGSPRPDRNIVRMARARRRQAPARVPSRISVSLSSIIFLTTAVETKDSRVVALCARVTSPVECRSRQAGRDRLAVLGKTSAKSFVENSNGRPRDKRLIEGVFAPLLVARAIVEH